jgi:hypothetical protein
MKFASRAEFAAHLTEHQHTKLWTCKKCGQTNSKRALIHTNIACAHPSLNSENHEGAIAETTLLRELSKQKCPFCDEVPGATKFVGHLCHHLEEISLSAVPRDADMEDENDGNSTQRSSLKSMSERNLEIGIQHVEHNSETDNSIASELLQFEQKLEEMVMSNNIPAIEAAGEEPDTIKCICDFLDDVGDTIYCGRCKTRQHVECYYPGLENGIFEHSCADCRPRPLDRNQANERHQYLLQRPTNPGTSISKTSLRPKAGRLSTKQQLEMNESSEKSHKPNLWKCKPCYDAGEKVEYM